MSENFNDEWYFKNPEESQKAEGYNDFYYSAEGSLRLVAVNSASFEKRFYSGPQEHWQNKQYLYVVGDWAKPYFKDGELLCAIVRRDREVFVFQSQIQGNGWKKAWGNSFHIKGIEPISQELPYQICKIPLSYNAIWKK